MLMGAFVGVVVLMLGGAVRAGASRSAAASWERVMLTDAAKHGAVCLDGSPGGYFLKRGDPQRWILFMQGGGWCTSTAVRSAPIAPGSRTLGSTSMPCVILAFAQPLCMIENARPSPVHAGLRSTGIRRTRQARAPMAG